MDNISTASGRAEIAYVGETPWHSLGKRVEGCPTADEMLVEAGIDFTVSLQPIFRQTSLDRSQYHGIDSHRVIVRDDTDDVLGMVTKKYHVIQNSQAARIVDFLMGEGATVEVAGALGRGEILWMLARIPGIFEVLPGDAINRFFLLAWGHDGYHGVAGKLTPIRVVCQNTLTAAGFGGGAKWSRAADVYVQHSANASINLEDARRALGIIQKETESTQAAYTALTKEISASQAAEYFTDVFPSPVELKGEERKTYEARLARWNEHQEALVKLYTTTGKGLEIPGVKGTAWAAYNAVTEWTDHLYPVLKTGTVSRVRQQGVAFGSTKPIKDRALFQALELVAGAEAETIQGTGRAPARPETARPNRGGDYGERDSTDYSR